MILDKNKSPPSEGFLTTKSRRETAVKFSGTMRLRTENLIQKLDGVDVFSPLHLLRVPRATCINIIPDAAEKYWKC